MCISSSCDLYSSMIADAFAASPFICSMWAFIDTARPKYTGLLSCQRSLSTIFPAAASVAACAFFCFGSVCSAASRR